MFCRLKEMLFFVAFQYGVHVHKVLFTLSGRVYTRKWKRTCTITRDVYANGVRFSARLSTAYTGSLHI